MRTVRIKKHWGHHLKLGSFPNAGPNPNITGMKKHYWGQNALIVKCGVYIYKVDAQTYEQALNLEGR